MVTVQHQNEEGTVKIPVSERPFGYPNPVQQPIKMAAVAKFGPVSEIYMVSDVDQELWPGNWAKVAPTSTHGTVRNRVYFDGSTRSFKQTGRLKSSGL